MHKNRLLRVQRQLEVFENIRLAPLQHNLTITVANLHCMHHDNIKRRISPECLNDFSVSSKQWFFSSLVQLCETMHTKYFSWLTKATEFFSRCIYQIKKRATEENSVPNHNLWPRITKRIWLNKQKFSTKFCKSDEELPQQLYSAYLLHSATVGKDLHPIYKIPAPSCLEFFQPPEVWGKQWIRSSWLHHKE